MTSLIEVLPNYEPKLNENNSEKVDLNIRDLQHKYPSGCICCGNEFRPRKFSSMIASHFNTAKHKKKCLVPANKLFKEDFGSSNNLTEAFDNKCKELRDLKKLNYEYKAEMELIKDKYEVLENLNIKLQERLNIETSKSIVIKCENLIDL
tara:strand:+ start:1027 stop:1476 length:450 start_codon:yes stop_codon:yes gene_type:complete